MNPVLHAYVHTVSVVGVHAVDVTVPFVGAAAQKVHWEQGALPLELYVDPVTHCVALHAVITPAESVTVV